MHKQSEADRAERIEALKQQIGNDSYSIKLHMDSLVQGMMLAVDLGFRPTPEPQSPGKAERIREAIRKIRIGDRDYCRAVSVDQRQEPFLICFLGRMWDLVRLLEQDDCEIDKDIAGGFQTRIAAVMEAGNRLGSAPAPAATLGVHSDIALFRGRVRELIEFCRQHVAEPENADHAD